MASTSFGLMTMPLTPRDDRGFDVRRLLGRADLAVADDDLDAELLALGLDLLDHVDEERKLEARAPSPG